MIEQALFQSLLSVLSVAEECVERKQTLPALVLLYSTIDTLAWLAEPSEQTSVRVRFTKFVDRYILPSAKLRCTSLELYAARCGIVHTLTADSRLADAGVRRVGYAWGTATALELEGHIERSAESGKLVAVHIADLAEAVRIGAADLFEAAERDADLEAQIAARSNRCFVSVSARSQADPGVNSRADR